MGSVCDTARGGHRLPDRPGREGRPHQGPPVPSLRGRAKFARGACPTTVQEHRWSWTARKEPGALGEPLYLDVAAALRGTKFADVKLCRRPLRSGQQGHHPRRHHLRAIDNADSRQAASTASPSASYDDVTNLSLPHHRGARHRSRRHHLLQVLGSGLRRHRRRQQELHQDHR